MKNNGAVTRAHGAALVGLVALLFLGAGPSPARAEALRLPSVIGDHMVVQQGLPITVWGWDDPGQEVRNGVKDPARITEMVELTRKMDDYRPMPIVFNEDDHYDFDEDVNNMAAAVKAYASWGYFDFRRDGESFDEGYQSVPVNWEISSERKKAFFEKVKEITGY